MDYVLNEWSIEQNFRMYMDEDILIDSNANEHETVNENAFDVDRRMRMYQSMLNCFHLEINSIFMGPI